MTEEGRGSLEFEIPKVAKVEIKKMSATAAFASDATTDALQFSARAMASRIPARHNTWL